MNRFFFKRVLSKHAAFRRVLVAIALLAVPVAAITFTAKSHAQAATTRSVTGRVVDKSGAGVKGAIVHLKDARSLAQRSYITDADGQFRFAALSTATDYELWADADGRRTDSKNLSSFDNKTAQEITLKLQ